MFLGRPLNAVRIADAPIKMRSAAPISVSYGIT
jgi:hypothetical protein